ncbi:MAG: hypothetical protein ACKV19_06585 [Verrucomicrobiales bacterium]
MLFLLRDKATSQRGKEGIEVGRDLPGGSALHPFPLSLVPTAPATQE